jgi:hypothetical protein
MKNIAAVHRAAAFFLRGICVKNLPRTIWISRRIIPAAFFSGL